MTHSEHAPDIVITEADLARAQDVGVSHEAQKPLDVSGLMSTDDEEVTRSGSVLPAITYEQADGGLKDAEQGRLSRTASEQQVLQAGVDAASMKIRLGRQK